MSLLHATRYVAIRDRALGTSCAEISRLIRTGHHGITLRSGAQASLRRFSRTSPTRKDKQVHAQPDENLRSALENYKTTVGLRFDETHFRERDLNNQSPGSQVVLHGYVTKRRDAGKNLSFAVFRTQAQGATIQLVSSGANENIEAAKAHATIRSLREWTPVTIKGTVVERAKKASEQETPSPLLSNGPLDIQKLEIQLTDIVALNSIPNDVVVKEEAAYGPGQRHLQLRTSWGLRQRLRFRSAVVKLLKDFLGQEKNFTEIETPLLFKSTPEGAREFLVPTREKGFAYALPQSPQQYKQLLMASGFDKYYQFAKCFRDEDLRADRQPEFTQLDLEMGFATEHEVMNLVEDMIRNIFKNGLKIDLPSRFPHLTYDEAMSRYGSDKPDLRFPATIHDLTKHLPDDFISKITPVSNPTIEAFKVKLTDDASTNRKFISDFFDGPEGKKFLFNPDGQPAPFIGDASKPLGGLAPLGTQFTMECPPEVSTEQGEVLIVQARPTAPHSGGSTALGSLRTALHKAAIAQGLIDAPAPTDFRFLWVTDFPLFTPSNDQDPGQGGTAGFSSTHHPFTAPKTAQDVDLLLTDPSKALAAHYDIVVNGVELGGGSRRIHHADIQEFIFRDVLKMEPRRIEDFRHLLDALKSGCPPHSGIALGFDRMIAMMTGVESVRDVIAFPKTGSGEDPLVGAPNVVTEQQLKVYHLKQTEEE
ncbi:hypothetical protein DM02DRAFT_558136 [Periconia macrospinosa]|uniref:Aminoacyl-transfer RNA synthetases class-II family profile domain-containing protein n=1 Tax=Periconia macrospinosa TaxID=97972 RepID=A0A2V1DYR2_9PLEO|nr:hypothetical protein DM02DRAFT_558136 [Periconia macrospinosa]